MQIIEVQKPLDLKSPSPLVLDLMFLGVGSAFALRHNQLNWFALCGDTHVLVDFGMTGPRALAEVAGLKPTDIDVVLPTHSHADHVGGIECLALSNRYIGQRFLKKPKMTMVVTEPYQSVLWDQTLRGGLEWNEDVNCGSRKLAFSDFFKVVRPTWKRAQPREAWEVRVGDLNIELFRTNHIPEQSASWESSFISYGLYFPDFRVFVSVDTKFDPELIAHYAPLSEVMFHDVQFFPGAVHAPLEDLRSLPPEVKEKMYLMHYGDNWQDQDIKGFAGWTEQGKRYRFDVVPA